MNAPHRIKRHALVALLAASFAASAHEGGLVPSLNALPLRDGNVSTTPARDHVFSCKTDFSNGRGSIADGAWLQGSTWDLTRKFSVQGEVWWPDAFFKLGTTDDERELIGNALPTDHPTGNFPVARNDPAARYDPNPNGIQRKDMDIYLPRSPRMASQPTCLPMGMIGVMLNGVALFNALDTRGKDALAHEVQDRCGGHPERSGHYHYHGNPACLTGADQKATLVGYALDGFGIYSSRDASGRERTNADLDACHGRVGKVMWDGTEVEMYHYVLTREYPYTLGCFAGTPVRTPFTGGGAGPGPGRRGRQDGPGRGPGA